MLYEPCGTKENDGTDYTYNRRHTVFEDGKYSFTRNDARRQFDVATVAGMLNVFYMTGVRMDMNIEGPAISLPVRDIAVEVPVDKDWNTGEVRLTFVDGAVAQNTDGSICVALVNRSPTESHKVRVQMPEGYKPEKMWKLESTGINDNNSPVQRDKIIPKETVLTDNRDIILSPCGFALIRYVR